MDALITAIGEQADGDVLKAMGVPLGDDGWPAVNPGL
jgi:putative selenate reductase